MTRPCVTCDTCKHWLRYKRHPMLGGCLKGEPPGCAGGFWGTDVRWCSQWESIVEQKKHEQLGK